MKNAIIKKMSKEQLMAALDEAAPLRNGTRAGNKASNRAKIAACRSYVASACRTADAEGAAKRHYAKLTANKAATLNPAKKAKKACNSKHTPPAAKPVAISAGNPDWAAEKTAKKAAKKAEPIFKKAIVPNKGMADSTQEYLIRCCWEEYEENGNENALAALRELIPTITTAPADVEPELYAKERSKIMKLNKSIADLRYRWERVQARLWVAVENSSKADKTLRTAKMMATKAKEAYAAAAEEQKSARYAKMIERNRHLSVCEKKAEARKAELEDAIRSESEYIVYWIAEDERLNKLLALAEEKLETAKLARQHERRQEALEEAFSQRYERAEWIPEKETACRYKVYNVAAKALYGPEAMQLLDEMNRLAEDKPAGYIQHGQALYAKFTALVRAANGPFVVDAKDCVVNNVTASQMSDFMGVEYGQKTPCKEMVLVNYDLTGVIKIYYKFIDPDYDVAQSRLHNLRVFVTEHMLNEGLEMHDGENKLSYQMLASSNSQQKKGQCYMGETETMKRTEKLREFGWSMEDAIARRTDNAAEWLKRNATMTTPSKIIKDKDGNTVSIARVLMMKDVDIETWCDNVTTVNGSTLTRGQRKKIAKTMFDGQAIWLKPDFATTQGRGTGMKFMAIALPQYKLPEFAIDIMGNKVRVADYDILMTKSCWKAAKMGQSWYEYRDMVTEMAKTCPGYDLLRSVRYSDREIGDEENPRNLARQATQQWVKIDHSDVEGLTRKTRKWLKNHKKYHMILATLGELDKPEEERSALAKLFNRFPQLVMHPYIQQWIKTAWTAKRDKACSGRLRAKGVYPYICQDPIAMIQILLEGRDPMDETLGVVPKDCVNLPKVKTGRKVYAIRYPANYMVGMVLTQVNCPEFDGLGNVAVLSYHGDTITRADGDFDGDEMLFLFDQLIIDLMERTIKQFNPGLIDFPHGKLACDKPFVTRKNFTRQVAEALVRAQEYNLVGLYSNLAVICLQQASLAKDSLTLNKWLNASIFAHVGAIVCLDMVKGADVPEDLTNKLKELNQKIRDMFKMPWNQLFSHKELTEEDVERRTNSTQDRIAGSILDDVGDFDVDFSDEEFDADDVACTENVLRGLLPACDTSSFRKMLPDDSIIRRLRGCRFEDENDTRTWETISNGEAIGLKDWLILGWHNASSLLWKMSGTDMTEKRTELNNIIREAAIANVRTQWLSKDGREWNTREKYATLVKTVVCDALGFWVMNDGTFKSRDNGIDAERKGAYAVFVLRIFAEDILTCADGLREEDIATMLEKKEESQVNLGFLGDLDPDELAFIMDDGSYWMSCDEC